MLRGDDVVGVIGVSRAQAGPFAPAEIALLQTFADQAVIAVENARLLDRAAGADGRAPALRRTAHRAGRGRSGRVARRSTSRRCSTTIVSRAVQLSGLDGGVVFEYDEATEEFEQRASTGQEALAEASRARAHPQGRGRGRAHGHHPRAGAGARHHAGRRLREPAARDPGRVRHPGAARRTHAPRRPSDGQPRREPQPARRLPAGDGATCSARSPRSRRSPSRTRGSSASSRWPTAQVGVPRQHVARAAHAAQRHHRLLRDAAGGGRGPRAGGAPFPISGRSTPPASICWS